MLLVRALALAALAALLAVLGGLALVLVAEGQGTSHDGGEAVALDGEEVFVHARYLTGCSLSPTTSPRPSDFEVGSSSTRARFGLDGQYLPADGPATLECDGPVEVVESPGLAVAVASRPGLALAPVGVLVLAVSALNPAYRRARAGSEAPPSAGTWPLDPVPSTPPATFHDPGTGLAALPVLADGTVRVRWPAMRWTGPPVYALEGARGARASLEPAAVDTAFSWGALLRGRGHHAARAFEVVTAVDGAGDGGPGRADDPERVVLLDPVPAELQGSEEPGRRVWGRIEKEAGQGSSFVVRVVEADGALLGTAVARGGMFSVFPEVVLSLASGEPVGSLTGRAERTLVDGAGQPRGRIAFAAPEVLMPVAQEQVVRLDLDPFVPPATRALVLGAWLGLELVRTG